MVEADTETLIAMVISLLTAPHPGQDVVLDALVNCGGDVEAAAAFIREAKEATKALSAKRQAPSSDLTSWLGSSNSSRPIPSSSKPPSLKKRVAEQSNAGRGPFVIKDTTRLPASPEKSSVDLMNVLRPALPSTTPPSSKPLSLQKRTAEQSNTLFTIKDTSHLPAMSPEEPSVDLMSVLRPAFPSTTPPSSKPPSLKKRTTEQSNTLFTIRDTSHLPAMSPEMSSVDLMSVLRPPPPSKRPVARLPPLTLLDPFMVAQHTPCTLHLSVLPPELACELFYTMLDLSQSWKRNKWWLFDRIVESPHRTSFFARRTNGVDNSESWQEAAQYWYNGRQTEPPEFFPEVMEMACKYVEDIVNHEIRKRERNPLEWSPGANVQSWHANVAASNCYEGAQESVGFHSDQLTYLGPHATIASLSLGTTRTFRLREVISSDEIGSRCARTFNIPLPHNSLTIMHAKCQESFKHSIPPQSTLDLYRPLYPHPARPFSRPEPSNCRINITFRFYRPDFQPSSIPRCKCGIPTILRPDMKNRHDGKTDKYWWACYAGAQNDGKGCDFWRVMDMHAEGRGSAFFKQEASTNRNSVPGSI